MCGESSSKSALAGGTGSGHREHDDVQAVAIYLKPWPPRRCAFAAAARASTRRAVAATARDGLAAALAAWPQAELNSCRSFVRFVVLSWLVVVRPFVAQSP